MSVPNSTILIIHNFIKKKSDHPSHLTLSYVTPPSPRPQKAEAFFLNA